MVKTDNGTQFMVRVNTSDILVIWEIWNAKVYDDPRFPIQTHDVVVDIGAHIGGFGIRAAGLARQVFAYEASGKNYAILEKNLQLNVIQNLRINNKAVSHQGGEMKFFMPSDNGALGSLLQDPHSPMEIVQAITLTDIIEDNNIEQIDFLKLDVEGAEYDILFSCPKETLEKIRYIVMEYHEFHNGVHNHRDLLNLLRSNGFQVSVEGGIFPQKFLFGTGIIKAWRN